VYLKPLADIIPQEIQPLLQGYLALTQSCLPGWISAVSLVGSIGLGDFDPRRSDVDFAALLSCRWDEHALRELASIHWEIQRSFPRWPMDGIYLQADDLYPQTMATHGSYPSCNDGHFKAAGRRGLSPVARWELKAHSVPLSGPAELPISVTWDEVVDYMHANLQTYWRGFTNRPVRMAWLLQDSGVEWAVLGILRL
jgi:hypothetical protein